MITNDFLQNLERYSDYKDTERKIFIKTTLIEILVVLALADMKLPEEALRILHELDEADPCLGKRKGARK